MSLYSHSHLHRGFPALALLVLALVALTMGRPLITVAGEPVKMSGLPQQGLPETDVVIAQQTYRVEVATTPEQLRHGLMFREELPSGQGMLFLVRPARTVQFWMKNTYIPLDIVFFSQGRVSYIARNVPPCAADPCPTYGPDVKSDMVLELPAGTVARDRVAVGDFVKVMPLTGVVASKIGMQSMTPDAGLGGRH